MKKNNCFGRINDAAFNNLTSLDDLIIKMGTTKDGQKVHGFGDPDSFKQRLSHFREYLKRELPEFSEEEILRIDLHFHKIKKIYEWYGSMDLLVALEYENRKK